MSNTSPLVRSNPIATLGAADIHVVRSVLENGGLVLPSTRFVYMGVDEPSKGDVLAALDDDESLDRRIRVILIDLETSDSIDVRVSVSDAAVVSSVKIDPAHGQPALATAEFAVVEEILAVNDDWAAALARRDLGAGVMITPLSAGNFGFDDEDGHRMVRVVVFSQSHEGDSPWAHPVNGLCAWVDLTTRSVAQIVDTGVEAVPAETGNYSALVDTGAPRTDLRPIVISQPDGPSFTIDDGDISWAAWRLHVGFDAREGLVLHRIRYVDGAEHRDIVYRASIAEMVVPYADPSPAHFFQNYFDAGEYLYGRTTNSLTLGCDCVGEITYLDAVLSDESGIPRVIENAICIHEEDAGTLWKHSDDFTGSAEVRRNRRLVVSSFTTVGNYDYGFFWYFYLDGRIECEAKLTGIVFTAAENATKTATSSRLAPGLSAPFHQHLFSARLDMMVDGVQNAVDEVDFTRMPVGEGNPYGNAFTTTTTRLGTESSARRDADTSRGRSWHVVNTSRVNRVGEPTGYRLAVEPAPTLLADPASSIAGRAAFARHHLWVTRYAVEERYPAGDFVYQSPAGEGLPAWTAANRSLDGEDIVLWHTFGPSHAPRLEDWPIMPVDHARFSLTPSGFFDRNPTLDAPSPTAAACGCHSDADACACAHDHASHPVETGSTR